MLRENHIYHAFVLDIKH